MSVNRKNTYTCNICRSVIVTIDREEGVKPFMLSCLATPNCEGTMRSSFYTCDQALNPQWEWFKPVDLRKYNKWTKEHIEKGGLVIQRIPPNINGIDDPVLRSVVDFISNLQFVSAATLQRKFRMSYMSAARILDLLIKRRFIESSKDKKGQHLVIDFKKDIPDFTR